MALKRVFATVGLVLLSAVCAAKALDPAFERPETGRLASGLFQMCISTDRDSLAYCQGFMRGAGNIWKVQHACSSTARTDQLFCAGFEEARRSLQESLSECADCDQQEGLRRFRDELRSAGEICTAGENRDENYCAGYNAQVEMTIARLLPFQPIDAGQIAEDAGLSHALDDAFLHFWGSKEFGGFAPCLALETPPKQMREVFVKFMRDNPAQQVGTTAVIALEKALYYGLCPGPQRGLKPHVEQCISWERVEGHDGARNLCDEEVAIEFVSKLGGDSSFEIERLEVQGGAFRLNSKLSGMPPMFTVCPTGYVSSVPFQAENSEPIRASRYSCVRK